MAKRYDPVSGDIEALIAEVREEFYGEALEGVSVAALFVSHDDPEKRDIPVLEHAGYAAAAVVKLTNTLQRACGLADAIIVIDFATWRQLLPAQHAALIDHELYHLEWVESKEGERKRDVQGRPKLALRKHDRHIGWFDEVIERHGKHSLEHLAARHLYETGYQLYFEIFEDEPDPPPSGGLSKAAAEAATRH